MKCSSALQKDLGGGGISRLILTRGNIGCNPVIKPKIKNPFKASTKMILRYNFLRIK